MTTCQDAPATPPVTRPPRTLSAAAFVSSFDRFAISPMLLMIASALGAPLSTAVTTASGYFLAYGLSQPLWGLLSDRFGRRAVLRATLLCAAATGVVSALAPNLPVLVGARIVTGACFGAVLPTSLTYVGDTVAVEHRQRALSDMMAATALGTTLATAFAGTLGEFLAWRVVFVAPAVCAVLCSFALRRLPEPARSPVTDVAGHVRTVLRNRWALLVFTLAFVEGAVLLGTMTLLAPALQSHGVSATGAGLATAAYGAGVVVLSRLVKKLTRHIPMWGLIAAGGAQLCLACGIVASQISITTVIVAAILLGGGWSFMHSSLQTWATTLAPQARGTAISFFAGALFIGSSVASSAAGPAAQYGQYALLFTLACLTAIPLTAAAVIGHRRHRPGSHEHPTMGET